MPLLHRIALANKFLVLGVLALLMLLVPSGLYLTAVQSEITAARAEAQGVQPMIELQNVVRLTQVHRGLTAGMLNGNEGLAQRRPETRDALNKAYATAQVGLSDAGLDSTWLGRWAAVQHDWVELEAAVAQRQLDAPQSTKRHTALVNRQLALTEDALDATGISLDPEAATYFAAQGTLMDAPRLAEQLGMMRAIGAGHLTQGSISPEGRARLAGLRQRAADLSAHMFREMDQAMAADAELKQLLAAVATERREQVAATLAYADRVLIEAAAPNAAAAAYFDEFTRSIDALYAFDGQATQWLRATLQQRADHLERTRVLGLGAAVVLLALVTGLAWAFVRSVTQPLEQAIGVARAVAAGDLEVPIPDYGSNELGLLMQALSEMKQRLAAVVGGVRRGAEGVATASTEIAQGNMDLSVRTEEQAGALEHTASSMAQLSSAVRHNAANAEQANQMALGASAAATRGGEVVGKAVETMRGINDSSKKIADIIGVIDGIAFQTNILALNAAVEAARAGDQGRGFAVVASEVRSLAGRSAEAAREIKALISDSVTRVEQGTALVDAAGSTMGEIVDAIRRVTEIMAEISTASAQQSQGVAQVGDAVGKMDQATQQNAALVEQSAAAAESLKHQAARLVDAVAVFRVDL